MLYLWLEWQKDKHLDNFAWQRHTDDQRHQTVDGFYFYSLSSMWSCNIHNIQLAFVRVIRIIFLRMTQERTKMIPTGYQGLRRVTHVQYCKCFCSSCMSALMYWFTEMVGNGIREGAEWSRYPTVMVILRWFIILLFTLSYSSQAHLLWFIHMIPSLKLQL